MVIDSVSIAPEVPRETEINSASEKLQEREDLVGDYLLNRNESHSLIPREEPSVQGC